MMDMNLNITYNSQLSFNIEKIHYLKARFVESFNFAAKVSVSISRNFVILNIGV